MDELNTDGVFSKPAAAKAVRRVRANGAPAGEAVDVDPVASDVGLKRQQTATSLLYHRLRFDILHGTLAPGERLRVETLRERYKIGSSPIREALSRLSSEELVNFVDQKGFQVSDISIEDLQELTRSRCLLNEIILREAIKNGDEAWEEAIVLAHHRLSRSKKVKDSRPELWGRHHRSFHDALVAACGSRWLRNMSMTLFDCAERYRWRSADLERSTYQERDVDQEHLMIMQATINRDTETAIRLLNEHAVTTARIIIDEWNKDLHQAPN